MTTPRPDPEFRVNAGVAAAQICPPGPAAPLLRRLAAGEGDGPVMADHVRQLLRTLGADPVADEAEPAGPAEPLTRKALRTLRLIAEGDSNSTAAEKLFVFERTVCTHLRNIDPKLRASRRPPARRQGLPG